MYTRESDVAAMQKYYADYISKNFGDLNALQKPLPQH